MSVNQKMTAIADAIREKTGGTSLLNLDQMAVAIAGIQGGSSGASGLSILVDEHFTLATDLLSPGSGAVIYQSEELANKNWYFLVIEKLNPALVADTYEGVAAYRLNGYNTNMIRWNKTAYSAAHYHTYTSIENGTVKLINQGATLPWLQGEYRLVIIGGA